MATGFLGTKELLPVLTATGHHDLAVRLFQSRTFPSWGYEVEQGATSVWERWDSFTKEHGFDGATGKNNAAMNSFSHYAFGAVMQWAFQTLAGIDTDGPGYQRILIRPHPPSPGATGEPKPIDWVKAHYDSIHGRISSEWRTNGADFELHTTIPPNTTATIFLPAKDATSATENGQPLGDTRGTTLLRAESGRVILSVESGSYHFHSKR
jgi:alpha-L-rhamnosidase